MTHLASGETLPPHAAVIDSIPLTASYGRSSARAWRVHPRAERTL